MVEAGGARMLPQHRFTSVELAKQMQKLGLEPRALAHAAVRARSAGWPDAAERLADTVEDLGSTHAGITREPTFLNEQAVGGASAATQAPSIPTASAGSEIPGPPGRYTTRPR